MVGKSSLVETRSNRRAKILLSLGRASKVDVAEALAKRLEVAGKDVERHAAALANRRVVRTGNLDELGHLADGTFVGANAGGYVAIES